MAIKTLPFLNKGYKRKSNNNPISSNLTINGGDPITPEKIEQYRRYKLGQIVSGGNSIRESITFDLSSVSVDKNSKSVSVNIGLIANSFNTHSKNGKTGDALYKAVAKDIAVSTGITHMSQYNGSKINDEYLSKLNDFEPTDFETLETVIANQVYAQKDQIAEYASNNDLYDLGQNPAESLEEELVYNIVSGTANNDYYGQKIVSLPVAQGNNQNNDERLRIYSTDNGKIVFTKHKENLDRLDKGLSSPIFYYAEFDGKTVGKPQILQSDYLSQNTTIDEKGGVLITGNEELTNGRYKNKTQSLDESSSFLSENGTNLKFADNKKQQAFTNAYKTNGRKTEDRINNYNGSVSNEYQITNVDKTSLNNSLNANVNIKSESVPVPSKSTAKFLSEYYKENGKEFNGKAVVMSPMGEKAPFSSNQIEVNNGVVQSEKSGSTIQEYDDVNSFQNGRNNNNRVASTNAERSLVAHEQGENTSNLGTDGYLEGDPTYYQDARVYTVDVNNPAGGYKRVLRREEKDYLIRQLSSGESLQTNDDGVLLELLKQNPNAVSNLGLDKSLVESNGTLNSSFKAAFNSGFSSNKEGINISDLTANNINNIKDDEEVTPLNLTIFDENGDILLTIPESEVLSIIDKLEDNNLSFKDKKGNDQRLSLNTLMEDDIVSNEIITSKKSGEFSGPKIAKQKLYNELSGADDNNSRKIEYAKAVGQYNVNNNKINLQPIKYSSEVDYDGPPEKPNVIDKNRAKALLDEAINKNETYRKDLSLATNPKIVSNQGIQPFTPPKPKPSKDKPGGPLPALKPPKETPTTTLTATPSTKTTAGTIGGDGLLRNAKKDILFDIDRFNYHRYGQDENGDWYVIADGVSVENAKKEEEAIGFNSKEDAETFINEYKRAYFDEYKKGNKYHRLSNDGVNPKVEFSTKRIEKNTTNATQAAPANTTNSKPLPAVEPNATTPAAQTTPTSVPAPTSTPTKTNTTAANTTQPATTPAVNTNANVNASKPANKPLISSTLESKTTPTGRGTDAIILRNVKKDKFIPVNGKMTSTGMVKTVVDGKVYVHPTVFVNKETGELYELSQDEAFEEAQFENELIELGEDNKENNLQANLVVKDTGIQQVGEFDVYEFKKNDDNSLGITQGLNIGKPSFFQTISADGTEKETVYYSERKGEERIKRYLYDEDGQYLGTDSYANTYDENGKLTKQEHTIDYNKHEDEYGTVTTVFDENGNVAEIYQKDVLTEEKVVLDEDPISTLDPKGGTREAPPVSETVGRQKATPFVREGIDNTTETTTANIPSAQNAEQQAPPVIPAATTPATAQKPLPNVNQTPAKNTPAEPVSNTPTATEPISANVKPTPATTNTQPAAQNTPVANKPLPSTTPQQEPLPGGNSINEIIEKNKSKEPILKNYVNSDDGIYIERAFSYNGETDGIELNGIKTKTGFVKTVKDGKVYIHTTVFEEIDSRKNRAGILVNDGGLNSSFKGDIAFELAKANGELIEIGEDNNNNNATANAILNYIQENEKSGLRYNYNFSENENGNIVLEPKFDVDTSKDDSPISIAIFDKENKIFTNIYDYDNDIGGTGENRWIREYNDNGEYYSRDFYDKDLFDSRIENQYDEEGNLVKQLNEYDYRGDEESTITVFDKEGNVLEQGPTTYDGSGNKVLRKDKDGNVLEYSPKNYNQLQSKTPKLDYPKPNYSLNQPNPKPQPVPQPVNAVEQPVEPAPANITQPAESVSNVQPINNEPAQPLPAPENPTTSIPNPPKRNGVRLNYDAEGNVIGESTHKMATETFDGVNWFSFPTLFQNEDGTWVDMSDRPWKEAYDEAQKRGEVIDFGTDKEGALAYGEGSWKENYNKQNGIPTPDKNTPAPLPTPLESGTANNLNYVQNRIDNQVPEYIARGTINGVEQPTNVQIRNIDLFEGYEKSKRQRGIVEQQIAENVSNALQRVDPNNPFGKNLNPLPSVLDRGPDWAEFRRMNDIVRNGTPYDFNRSEFFTPNLDFNPPTINPDEGYILGVPERLRPIVPPHVSGFNRPSIKLPTDPIGVAESGVDKNGNSIIERPIYGPNVTNFKRPTINAVDETGTVDAPVDETTPVTNETNTEVTTPIEGETSTPNTSATTETNAEAAKSNASINRSETNFSMGGRIYDMATSINMLRAASNYTQPPPPVLQTERMNPSRIRVDRSPYEMAAQQMTAQGNQVMNSLQDNTGSASTLLGGAAQIGTNMANAQNQINAQYSQAAQGVMAQNAQMQQQANQFNAQMGTQNNQVNAQLQLQAAQGKQTAIDNNVNAALAAQAQKENYLNQKEYVYKQSEIQRRAMQYQLDMQAYNQRLLDPNLNMEYQSQVDAFNEGFNKIYGPGTEKYNARMAEMEKQYEDASQYGTLLPQYNTLLESYGGDEAKIAELNKQTKNLLVQQAMTKDYIGPTLTEYKKNQGFDEKQVYQSVYGAMPELNFDDLIMYQ